MLMTESTKKPMRERLSILPFVYNFLPLVCCLRPHTVPNIGLNIPIIEKQRNTGFTLNEMLIALTIVAILSAVAAPSFRQMIQNQRMTTQANELIGDLYFARSEAIKRATRTGVCKLDPASATPACNTTASALWSSGRLVFIDANNDGQYKSADGDTLLKTRETLEGGNKLGGDGRTAGTANFVAFNDRGATTATANTGAGEVEVQLRLCDSRGSTYGVAVVLQPITGRARISDKGKDMKGGALVCP
jgi:type IV fimbrial biogenesis protein FimT